MRIFLFGFMGSGKTTFGKKLAKSKELQFFDLDDYIEERERRTIKHIFEKDGEDAFRKIENEALIELLKNDNYILACGGGTPCFYNNVKLMNSNGITIYLDLDIKSIVNRLINAKVHRPLIWGKSEIELTDYVKQTLEKRNPFYLQAQIKTDAFDPNIETVKKKIKKKQRWSSILK